LKRFTSVARACKLLGGEGTGFSSEIETKHALSCHYQRG